MKAALAIVCGLAFAGAMFVFVRWVARRATATALAAPEVQGAAVVSTGRLVGAFGVGSGIVRGTGVVALHRDRILFVLAAPKRVMELPLALITEVEVTKVLRFPRRYARLPRPMLVLRAGEAAGLAVLVRNPQALADAIKPGRYPGPHRTRSC